MSSKPEKSCNCRETPKPTSDYGFEGTGPSYHVIDDEFYEENVHIDGKVNFLLVVCRSGIKGSMSVKKMTKRFQYLVRMVIWVLKIL